MEQRPRQPLPFLPRVVSEPLRSDESETYAEPREKTGPIHNSIAPVPQLVEAGVNVALGVDNVHDYFCPYIDGDIFTELMFLIETTRYYDVDELVKIATVNGRKILESV